jgi:hypothetical protein
MVVPGVLTSSGGTIRFTIPTGRVLANTNIEHISFDILARVANYNTGNQHYLIKKTSGGYDFAHFDSYIGVSGEFYNLANELKDLPTSWTKIIHGNTNIYVEIAGGTNYFSGAELASYVNNQPLAIELNNVEITLS